MISSSSVAAGEIRRRLALARAGRVVLPLAILGAVGCQSSADLVPRAAVEPLVCQPSSPSPESSAAEPRLAICLRRVDLLSGYTYDSLLKAYPRVEGQPCDVVITERDIAAYRISREPRGRVEIQLTKRASAQLIQSVERPAHSSAPFDLGFAVCGEGFFDVTLDGSRLYVGQCYLRIGAAALQYPVMHIEEEEDGEVFLRIGAVQGTWLIRFGTPRDDQRVDPPALRKLFHCEDALEKVD